MTASHIPEHSGSRHGLVEGKEEEESIVKKQKNCHDIRSSSTPDDPSHEASRASRFGPDNTVHLAEPSASALLHAGDEYLKHRVRDDGPPRASKNEDASTLASVASPERLERESRFSALKEQDERLPEHRHHHDGPPTTVQCHTVLQEESETHDDDDDNAAPPHPHPHLQLPQRSPQRRGRADLSPPPPPLKSPNAAAGAGGGGAGGVGGAGATTGHQRSSSAPVKPLKSAFAAPKSPPLACSSPSSETGGSGSGATSPSTAGMKKRARFEDEDGGLERGVEGGRGSGELELMLGRGLGGPGRSLFSGEDQEEEEAGFAESTLVEENDDGEDVDLPASAQDEGEDDVDGFGGGDVGGLKGVQPREVGSDESLRDVLQAEVDDAADELHEDAAEREDASMGERDSASGEDAVMDDEERSLDLRDDIVNPLQDPAYDQEESDQEDEGTSGFALAEYDQATDDSRTRLFDNQDQLNADVGLGHQDNKCAHLASIDEGKATQRARLPFFSRPLKPANIRRLSDSHAERDVRDAGIVPRRASSMGDFNRLLHGRPTLRPLPAKAAPAGVALTATSVHPAEQHKINPIYQHPNARWRHDVYDSRKPTRTEQTVYSGSTKYQILWEEPPQSDTDSDTTLIVEENVETPQVIEPDSDSILAHISRSPSPMGKLRTKLAAWSWAQEQEELGMGDEEDKDEAGQGGGGAKATSQLMPAAGAACLLSTRRRSPIEDATGSEGPPAPPNTAKSGASSAQRSAPQTPFLECRDEGGQCGIRVEAPDAFDPDTGHTVESQGEFLDVDDVGEEGEEEAGLVIGLGSSSPSSWSNAAADMHRLLKPALSRVRSATLPPCPAATTTTTTTLDYLSFPATASSSRLPGPSLSSSSILQQQQQQQQHHHNLANPSFSRHFSNITQEEEEDRFRTHRDSVDIHHRRLNNEGKMNTHLQATRDSFLITKSKYDARLRSHNPYLPLQHQHPFSSSSSPTHIQCSRFGGLSPILDASPPSSGAATTTTKQSAKSVPISSSASKTPSGEVPVKVTVLEGEESSEEDEPVESAHPDEHVGCAICAVERPRWFEARHRRKMQV
ncbi:hypothetical protein D0866_07036 [Hortaea werneckii]|uniref:Uncharacterized protein n=1 Tax=Hortaea werneckii TaxID=91943 RepID=A0A3M7AW79_HORWE|nr:hypothetical protein D0866_07036 [Hortaea werneckii]